MADSKITRGRSGFTGFHGEPSLNNGLSGLVLRGSDGYDRALWVDTSGKLRIADIATVEAAAFNPDSDGDLVGAQSA